MEGIKRSEAKRYVGRGWHHLIDRIYDMLEKNEPNYVIVQVKEKLGGLRVYAEGGTVSKEGLEFIWGVEKQSLSVCEVCGAEGQLRTDRAWYKALCDSHATLSSREVFKRGNG
jgi:hypothetical protein